MEIEQWHRLQRPHSVKIRASGPISAGPRLGPQQNHNKISANKSYDPIALFFRDQTEKIGSRDHPRGSAFSSYLLKTADPRQLRNSQLFQTLSNKSQQQNPK